MASRVDRRQISIPLRSRNKPVNFNSKDYAGLRKEYATRYLDRLGACATPANIAMVEKNIPLEKCSIKAAWKSRGSVSDVLAIDPFQSSEKYSIEEFTVAEKPKQDSAFLKTTFGTDLEVNYHHGIVHQSFNDIKCKFLKPFNELRGISVHSVSLVTSIHPSGIKNLRKWKPTGRTRIASGIERIPGKDALEELSIIPSETIDTIGIMQMAFFTALPFDIIDPTHTSTNLIRSYVVDDMGLITTIEKTIQYLYWNFLRLLLEQHGQKSTTPSDDIVRPSSEELSRMYLQLLHLYASVKSRLMRLKKGPSLYLPLVLLSIRVCVETTFINTFPLWFAETSQRGEVRYYILISFIFKILVENAANDQYFFDRYV